MAFDIGNGLSAMGMAISKTAGDLAIESAKAELEQQKIKLADELAGAREEKHRGFLTSERLSTQEFTGAENEKTRATTLEGHKISAGASLQAAREHIAAQLQMAGEVKINDDGTSTIVNKVTGKMTPILGADGQPAKFRDPDLAKTRLEAVRATSVQLSDLERKYQVDVQAPRQALLQVQKDIALQGPEKQAAIASAQADLDAVEKRYKPEFMRLNSRLDGLAESLMDKGGVGPKTTDLSRFMKPAPTPVTGLIDQPPEL